MAKAALLAVFAALFVLSAALFDAASGARAAMDLNRAALEAKAPAPVLARAEREVLARWSQPARWHAGAVEALSWTQILRGDLAAAGATAERGIGLAPVQPAAWLRLGALRDAGIKGGLCNDAPACLERSWTAAIAAEPELQCARLDLARALGETPDADDPRVRALIAARPSRETLARCLAFLPPEDLFAALGALTRPR